MTVMFWWPKDFTFVFLPEIAEFNKRTVNSATGIQLLSVPPLTLSSCMRLERDHSDLVI